MKDLGLWFRGQEQREETSRPHPFKEPLEQRLPGPRGVGPAPPPPPAPRPEPAEPAHPRPARAQGAGARSALAAPSRRRLPGSRRPPPAGKRRGGGLGSRVAEDAECLASPTSSLFRSNGPGRSLDKRADTVTRDRNLIPPLANRAAPRPLPQRAPHLRRARLRWRRRRPRWRRGPGGSGCVTPAVGGAGAPRPIRGRGRACGPEF